MLFCPESLPPIFPWFFCCRAKKGNLIVLLDTKAHKHHSSLKRSQVVTWYFA